jgi:hypothetical protein
MKTKTKLTQQLFVLNQLSEQIDLNLFDRITIAKTYSIMIAAKYNVELYKYLKNKYGEPITICNSTTIDLVFSTEVIRIILEVQLNDK